MAEKKDYYESLGVTKSATKDEIKSAYRKLAKTYHPDNKETGNETKFKEIQEAYDVLYDDKKRQMYDQFGHAAFEQGAGGGAGGNPFGGGFGGFGGGFGGEDINLGDIFSSFFGGGSRQSNRTSNGPSRGQDILMRTQIDFMDAINGKHVDISFNFDEECPNCHGSGAKDPSKIQTCSYCHGSGHVRTQRRTLFGVMENDEPCPNCGGTGKIVTEKCPSCGGQGHVRKRKTITLNIPAGINNGQQIRQQGMGEIGPHNGPHGDLYIEINVKPHAYFKRDGNDIHITIPLDFVDAILGTQVEIPTVYGNKLLSIPAGTQPGQIMRMKGHGVKDLRSGKPGDQYVHLDIKMPTSLSKKQKEILEDYKKNSSVNDSFFEKFKRNFK